MWSTLQIYPHGSTDTLPFATMGSGSLAAMAIFESKYKEGLTVSLPVIFGIYIHAYWHSFIIDLMLGLKT